MWHRLRKRPGGRAGTAMSTVKIERLREDGPYVSGETIQVPVEPDELVPGIIREVVPTSPRRVRVTVEITDSGWRSGPGWMRDPS